MAPTYKGATVVQWSEWVYNQDEGLVQVRKAKGLRKNVESFARAWKSKGYDVSVTGSGPYWEMTATRTDNYSARYAIERWALQTEILEKDIYSHPDVSLAMYSYSDGPAKFTKLIEEAVETGNSSAAAGSGAPAWLIPELSRGVEAYEHEYHILSRTVTFPMEGAQLLDPIYNMTLQLSRQILSYSDMASIVPADVLFTLPQDRSGTDAANDATARLQWGWRVREQRAEIDTSTTGTFQQSWTYAAWSTFLYTPFATP